MDDPYDIDLPDGWTYAVDFPRVVYEDTANGVRIAVEEFAKQLTLYWWVDVYTREDGEWGRRTVGLGDTYRDPESAAEDVQLLVENVDEGRPGLTEAPLEGAAESDAE